MFFYRLSILPVVFLKKNRPEKVGIFFVKETDFCMYEYEQFSFITQSFGMLQLPVLRIISLPSVESVRSTNSFSATPQDKHLSGALWLEAVHLATCRN